MEQGWKEWRGQSQQLHGTAHQMAHETRQLQKILWCKENGGNKKTDICLSIASMINRKGVRKPQSSKQVQLKIEPIEQTFWSAHDWATHTSQGIEEDNPDSFHATVEKRCQYYFDLLDIFADHASAQPWVSSDRMETSKAMHTSPRRVAHRMNYLESDSSDEDKDKENDEHD